MPKKEKIKAHPLLLALANWASDVHYHQSPLDYQLFFDHIFKSYLISTDANDLEKRTEAVVVFGLLESLVEILDRFNQDFDTLDRWIQEQVNASCPEAA